MVAMRRPLRASWGTLHFQRAYYHCEKCHCGFCPRDRQLRLEQFSLTPGVLRMTGSTAALLSFQESSALLHELAGVNVSASQVERAAETLGADLGLMTASPTGRLRTIDQVLSPTGSPVA